MPAQIVKGVVTQVTVRCTIVIKMVQAYVRHATLVEHVYQSAGRAQMLPRSSPCAVGTSSLPASLLGNTCILFGTIRRADTGPKVYLIPSLDVNMSGMGNSEVVPPSTSSVIYMKVPILLVRRCDQDSTNQVSDARGTLFRR